VDEGQDEMDQEGKQEMGEETKQWLHKNGFVPLFQAGFIKDSITIQDLVHFTTSDCDNFCDELKIGIIWKVRFRKAVQELVAAKARQSKADEWDTKEFNLEEYNDGKRFHVNFNKNTVTLRNESSYCHVGLFGRITVSKGECRKWRFKIIRIAKQRNYYEAYLGIECVSNHKAFLRGETSLGGYGVIKQFSTKNKQNEIAQLQYGGIILDDGAIYGQKDINKKINEGDMVETKLDLINGQFTVKVNNQNEMVLWQWEQISEDLQYKMCLTVSNSSDDYQIQLL